MTRVSTAPHGTRAAYARHRRRHEDACAACLRANRERSAASRATATAAALLLARQRSKADSRAKLDLTRRYRDEWRELYDAHLAAILAADQARNQAAG